MLTSGLSVRGRGVQVKSSFHDTKHLSLNQRALALFPAPALAPASASAPEPSVYTTCVLFSFSCSCT